MPEAQTAEKSISLKVVSAYRAMKHLFGIDGPGVEAGTHGDSLGNAWDEAKKTFERNTGERKPDAGFFHKADLEGPLKRMEAALAGNALDEACKILSEFRSNSADYHATLDNEAANQSKSPIYRAEVAKMKTALADVLANAERNIAAAALATAKEKAPDLAKLGLDGYVKVGDGLLDSIGRDIAAAFSAIQDVNFMKPSDGEQFGPTIEKIKSAYRELLVVKEQANLEYVKASKEVEKLLGEQKDKEKLVTVAVQQYRNCLFGIDQTVTFAKEIVELRIPEFEEQCAKRVQAERDRFDPLQNELTNVEADVEALPRWVLIKGDLQKRVRLCQAEIDAHGYDAALAAIKALRQETDARKAYVSRYLKIANEAQELRTIIGRDLARYATGARVGDYMSGRVTDLEKAIADSKLDLADIIILEVRKVKDEVKLRKEFSELSAHLGQLAKGKSRDNVNSSVEMYQAAMKENNFERANLALGVLQRIDQRIKNQKEIDENAAQLKKSQINISDVREEGKVEAFARNISKLLRNNMDNYVIRFGKVESDLAYAEKNLNLLQLYAKGAVEDRSSENKELSAFAKEIADVKSIRDSVVATMKAGLTDNASNPSMFEAIYGTAFRDLEPIRPRAEALAKQIYARLAPAEKSFLEKLKATTTSIGEAVAGAPGAISEAAQAAIETAGSKLSSAKTSVLKHIVTNKENYERRAGKIRASIDTMNDLIAGFKAKGQVDKAEDLQKELARLDCLKLTKRIDDSLKSQINEAQKTVWVSGASPLSSAVDWSMTALVVWFMSPSNEAVMQAAINKAYEKAYDDLGQLREPLDKLVEKAQADFARYRTFDLHADQQDRTNWTGKLSIPLEPMRKKYGVNENVQPEIQLGVQSSSEFFKALDYGQEALVAQLVVDKAQKATKQAEERITKIIAKIATLDQEYYAIKVEGKEKDDKKLEIMRRIQAVDAEVEELHRTLSGVVETTTHEWLDAEKEASEYLKSVAMEGAMTVVNLGLAVATMASAPATGGATVPLAAYALAKSALQLAVFVKSSFEEVEEVQLQLCDLIDSLLLKSMNQQRILFTAQQAAAGVLKGAVGVDLSRLTGWDGKGVFDSLNQIDGLSKTWSGKLSRLEVGHHKMAADLGTFLAALENDKMEPPPSLRIALNNTLGECSILGDRISKGRDAYEVMKTALKPLQTQEMNDIKAWTFLLGNIIETVPVLATGGLSIQNAKDLKETVENTGALVATLVMAVKDAHDGYEARAASAPA